MSDEPMATEPDAPSGETDVTELAPIVESLLFLSQDPVNVKDLAEATDAEPSEIEEALAEIQQRDGGIVLREIAGGWTLASIPAAEKAARRLLAKPRTPPLTQAQAECLSIVAYLQPVSRPEIARIRGVASESAVATLEERGLIEDCGRSQFGAILYRTSSLFQRLFGLASLDALPDPSAFDPSPEEEGELRDRLLRAGEIRAGGPNAGEGQDALPLPTIAATAAEPDGEADATAAAGEAEADENAPAPAESFAGGSAPDADAAAADVGVPDADAADTERRPSVVPFAGGADPEAETGGDGGGSAA
jgi:segregation and condensation protein B